MAASRGRIVMPSLLQLRPVFSLSSLNLRKTVALYSRQVTTGQSSADNISTQENNGTATTSSPDRFPEGFNGAGLVAFGEEFSKKLMAPVNEEDIEIKPDGLIYLPEIKYRRILNHAFGPGGWALVPRGDSLQFQSDKDNSQLIVREYALFCFGRYVSQAAGEHTFYSSGNMVYGKAMEAAKSNALMRCCKDLGVASELWDPQFIIKWKEKYSISTWCENVKTKEKKKMWRRKDRKPTDAFFYPWKEVNNN
ncbi:mitochondrial genome maintenance protein MGM101-like [Actinia tenebrosa]|uniref:Mitochondrial genome maintenance protein MGM101-like n=1 Tax=Actinia tenebrosa TaxID=6105 RepID=A0A6P8I8T7_ACTTE|nr:mitochondrial genome maintenance protein MGM101-like [Actinia tenebrosa]XP_031561507.1 mitochondrial genome maintenance protein MGM101-like [Actinia tenebrosa]